MFMMDMLLIAAIGSVVRSSLIIMRALHESQKQHDCFQCVLSYKDIKAMELREMQHD